MSFMFQFVRCPRADRNTRLLSPVPTIYTCCADMYWVRLTEKETCMSSIVQPAVCFELNFLDKDVNIEESGTLEQTTDT